ncbi:hypothetical protein JCM30237_24500 [Halolamina litorea]|uniref:Uncharacterized protein n=1 Tax=Halolamina litorea TaxID=1515593 RepID=A0ABD6BUN7_9EURY|nr:hypothetical protein [Halolamina litorea]
MATTATQSSQKEQFSIDTRDHGHPDGPAHVLVEVSPAQRGVLMAVCAAGGAGRCSFDFSIDDGVKVQKAFIGGERAAVEELPAWVDPIRERIETEIEG